MRRSLRNACSLVLRRTATDAEVYLVRRAETLRFFGGFWAFPGGAAHASDERTAARVDGVERHRALEIATAAREALEELGLWLGEDPVDVDRARRAVLDDEAAFAAAVEAGTHIPGRRLRRMLTLLTPPFIPTRFDTTFFEIRLDEWEHAGTPTIWEGELTEGRWDLPGRWLERWRRGEILIAPPVVLMLDILDQYGFERAQPELERLEDHFGRGELHSIFFNPAVQLLPLRTPTILPATHTNAYLIGRDPAYLVDPATPYPDEQARLDACLDAAIARGRRIEAILLTHHHPDHVGAVMQQRRARNLPVWAHPITRDLLAGEVEVDRLLDEGDVLPLGRTPDGRDGWQLEVLFTPGHAAGHLCFFEREYGSLVLGDMISTLSSILIHPDDGDMQVYLRSLERLARLPSRMVFPAHGPASNRGPKVLQAQLAHRREREDAVLAAVDAGASSVHEVVEAVYTDVPPPMHGFAGLSVRSILRKLEREGKVTRSLP